MKYNQKTIIFQNKFQTIIYNKLFFLISYSNKVIFCNFSDNFLARKMENFAKNDAEISKLEREIGNGSMRKLNNMVNLHAATIDEIKKELKNVELASS